MNNPSQEIFRTSDTPLAAYLIEQGFGTPEIEYNNGSRAFFIFSRENSKIEQAIADYDRAKAKGNIVLFFQAYQTLLRRIRERY